MLMISTAHTDVYRNLALEEWLLEHAPQLPFLFLYVNESCVVIGKNQNPWKECRLSSMEQEGVKLARRISGGGAVYHDTGNLNFSVIVPRAEYRAHQQYELILYALQKVGVDTAQVQKNSLVVSRRKFSGQAFCHRRNRTLHHGTLLVNTDLDRLNRYLGPELRGIETKAVASIPSEVVNLSQIAPGLTIEKISIALIETFEAMYGSGKNVEAWESGGGWEPWKDEHIPEEELGPYLEKNSSRKWTLEQTPSFSLYLKGKKFSVEKGCLIGVEGSPSLDDFLKTRGL